MNFFPLKEIEFLCTFYVHRNNSIIAERMILYGGGKKTSQKYGIKFFHSRDSFSFKIVPCIQNRIINDLFRRQ